MSELAETPIHRGRRERVAALHDQAGHRHPGPGAGRPDRRHPRGAAAPRVRRRGAAAAGARGRRGAPAPDDAVGDVGARGAAARAEDRDDQLRRAAGGRPAPGDPAHRDRRAGHARRTGSTVARYSVDDLRHIAYHVRLNRAGALFARCWLFVEGETEAWLLPELAQICGYDFPAEGIRCVEFAQSGLQVAAAPGQRPRDRVAPADRRRRGRARLPRLGAGRS